ncbi:hypothetical protein HGM15179_002183 [Zosterops borbonicus]|uniref:Uncharacterized protein n=1 Tax=Zosterops borbonicus TaxID=364589 RepID=A0A8K1LSZ4_9PASS|nr:hypothetical protein HGM15179_002183 [Zosterops borbonicus]
MSKSLKKIVEESREKNQPEVDMCDRGISSMLDVPGLCRQMFIILVSVDTIFGLLSNTTECIMQNSKLWLSTGSLALGKFIDSLIALSFRTC